MLQPGLSVDMIAARPTRRYSVLELEPRVDATQDQSSSKPQLIINNLRFDRPAPVRLLRGSRVLWRADQVRRCKSDEERAKWRLPRRQELEERDFLSAAELRALDRGHAGEPCETCYPSKQTRGDKPLKVVSISHGWLTQQHPDPLAQYDSNTRADRAPDANAVFAADSRADAHPVSTSFVGADAAAVAVADARPHGISQPRPVAAAITSTHHIATAVFAAIAGAVAPPDAGTIASSHHRLSIWNVPDERVWLRKLYRGKVPGRTWSDGMHHLRGGKVQRYWAAQLHALPCRLLQQRRSIH